MTGFQVSFNPASTAVLHRSWHAPTGAGHIWGIEMNQFTAAIADQHRADLMSAAQRAREARLAVAGSGPRFRVRLRRHALRAARQLPVLARVAEAR
jgi:hypothetical protein